MSDRLKIGAGVLAVAAAVVLFVVLKGDDSNDTSTTSAGTPAKNSGKKDGAANAIPVVRVRDGKPVGGIQKFDYNKGDQIRIKVVSDVGDEVHFHGYDIGKDVKPGGSVTFDLPASIEGVFEMELESRGEQIAEVRVNP